MSLANLTDEQLAVAKKTELERIAVAAGEVKNDYGDLTATPNGCRIAHGRRGGYKATELLGWTKYGRPKKRVAYATSDFFEQLCDETDKRKKLASMLAKKTAEVEAAKAAGFASVAAWKKSVRERKAVLAARAVQDAKEDAKEDEANWLKVVTEVLDQKDYAFTPAVGVEKVLKKIAAAEGVGAAWNSGDFEGGRHAFVRCVLGAADRHENSTYELLLKAGYDREDALSMRERF
jgi:hypothetical protein